MNRLWHVPLLALIISATAACGGNDEVASGTFDDGEGGKGTFTVRGEDDNSETVIKSGDGEVRFATGDKAVANLPMGISLYPGAKIESSMSGQGDGQSGAMIVFTTDDDQDDVIDFYKSEMKSKGLDVKAEISTGDMKMVSGENDSGQGLNLSVTKDGEGGVTATLIAGGDS